MITRWVRGPRGSTVKLVLGWDYTYYLTPYVPTLTKGHDNASGPWGITVSLNFVSNSSQNVCVVLLLQCMITQVINQVLPLEGLRNFTLRMHQVMQGPSLFSRF